MEVSLSIKLSDKIEMRSPLSIKPYWRNPRLNDATIEALVEVLPVIGFNVPIVVDKEGVIIKGHARHSAAIRLGLESIPVIVSDNSDEVNRLDRIADNRVFEVTRWDESELAELPFVPIPNGDKKEQPLEGIIEKDEYEFICPYCGAVVKVKI